MQEPQHDAFLLFRVELLHRRQQRHVGDVVHDGGLRAALRSAIGLIGQTKGGADARGVYDLSVV